MTYEELADAVYQGLRAGSVSDDLVIELAVAMERLGHAVPEDLDAHALVADYARLREALEEAVRTVQRDLDATGVPGRLRLVAPEWGGGWLRVEYDGQASAQGFDAHDMSDLLVDVADAAQEIIVEALWTGWPSCPEHGFGLHPARDATWVCKAKNHHTVAPIGQLRRG